MESSDLAPPSSSAYSPGQTQQAPPSSDDLSTTTPPHSSSKGSIANTHESPALLNPFSSSQDGEADADADADADAERHPKGRRKRTAYVARPPLPRTLHPGPIGRLLTRDAPLQC